MKTKLACLRLGLREHLYARSFSCKASQRCYAPPASRSSHVSGPSGMQGLDNLHEHGGVIPPDYCACQMDAW